MADEEPLVIRFPEQRAERTSAIVDGMQAERRKPREIRGRDLTPSDIHYDYVKRWQAEGRLIAEAEVREASAPAPQVGRWRRAWRAFWEA